MSYILENALKKYNIIYADPPWEYKQSGGIKNSRGMAKQFYDTMSIEQIKKIPVESLADSNCILFLWATYPQISEAVDVLQTWGFEYKTVAFTWVKKTLWDKEFVGMGAYTRANPEIVLLGIRGRPVIISHKVRQLVYARINEHSEKPDIIRKKIIQLMGDLPRIELFARSRVHGWDVWGNDEKLQNQPLEVFDEKIL